MSRRKFAAAAARQQRQDERELALAVAAINDLTALERSLEVLRICAADGRFPRVDAELGRRILSAAIAAIEAGPAAGRDF